MENITLKEHKIENDCFETKMLPFAAADHLVVEFKIEKFGISGFDEEDQKGSHTYYIYNKLPNHFSDFKCSNSY